jgi:hypothetical protein
MLIINNKKLNIKCDMGLIINIKLGFCLFKAFWLKILAERVAKIFEAII